MSDLEIEDSTGESHVSERDELHTNLDLSDGNTSEIIYDETIFPSLIVRIKALVIDFLIILIVFTATTLFIDAFGDIPSFVKGFILIFMIWLYDPVLTSFTGSTLGHKMMKLKVRKFMQPESKISIGQAILRFLTKWSLGWISFLTVTSNDHKRAIHDLVSGSIVLKDN